MKKKVIKICIGVILMSAGLFNATLHINNTWHYFSNGVVFGLGLALVISTSLLFRKKK